MRRADRLFQIVQHLRGGRLLTARSLAARLEVSERTIYRDIADLQASGVPVEGEAGVGYVMQAGYELPPMMFTHEEIVALVAGARMIRAWGGHKMAAAAEEALIKIETVLPEAAAARARSVHVHAMSWNHAPQNVALLDQLEPLIDARRVIEVDYETEAGEKTTRVLRPLGLYFWGKVWTLVAWCDLRDDFRVFRVDRFTRIKDTGAGFRPEAGKSLRDFHRIQDCRHS